MQKVDVKLCYYQSVWIVKSSFLKYFKFKVDNMLWSNKNDFSLPKVTSFKADVESFTVV